MADTLTTSGPGGKVEITVLEAKYLAKLGRTSIGDVFRIQLSLGDQTITTKIQNPKHSGDEVSCNQTVQFTFNGEMPNLALEIRRKTFSRRKYVCVGRVSVSYADLDAGDTPAIGIAKIHELSLSDKDGHAITTPKIPTLKISVKTIALGAQEHIDDLAPILRQASDALDRLKGPNIPDPPEQVGAAGSAVASLGSILGKISAIADIMDEVTKIHPYAKAAWDILDLARKVIKAQMQEDENIRDLFKQMNALLKRISNIAEKLQTVAPSDAHTADIKNTLSIVVSTSRECATFITTFCASNFGKRAMKCALFGDASKTIKTYSSTLGSLEEDFNRKVWDDTNINVHRIREDQTAGQVAEFMVQSASLLGSDKRACFTGTRVTILKEIMDWIERVDEDVPRVLLLSGMAGTGKSTIAYTIASEWNDQDRPCAYFAFNRSAQPPPVARMLFPHIAASLAAFCPVVKAVLADPKKRDIALGNRLERQLKELIIAPLKQSALAEPVLLAFDAIDEADDDGEQATELASLLSTNCGQLPSNVRVLVTSRSEVYISDRMQSPTLLPLSMPESSDTMSDVVVFIRAQLLPLHLIDINKQRCDKLAETSQGLFQWAATACNEIKAPLRGGSTPYQRYKAVVASGVGRDKSGLLDSLYKSVLERAYNLEKNPDGHCLLKKVIAALFVLWEPMTLDTFGRLLGEGSDAEATLPDLASILDGISDRTRPVQPNHTSLRDFFLDPDRSESFCVKDLLSEAHGRLARSSFSIVSTSLPQDVCMLDFARLKSYSLGYVESEADRVHRDVPPYLGYTVLYWVKHLAEAPAPQEAFWIDMGSSFLAGDRALRWIEVFCLLALHRPGSVYDSTPPELSGCIRLLAHITMRPGSSCPEHVQSVIELLSTIIHAVKNPPFSFGPTFALFRLRAIYRSVGWTVRLRRQPKGGPSVTVGSGFFFELRGASHDVILTNAHNLVDTNGQPHTDLVLDVPQHVPRLDGASQFTDAQYPVPSTDIHVCADFSQRPQLETDWGAILLPRGTMKDGFKFDIQSGHPDVMGVGIYGITSWIPHHLAFPAGDSNNSVDNTFSGRTAHVSRLKNPVSSGAPFHTLAGLLNCELYVCGICNPTYGDGAYTKWTTAIVHELASWVGLGRSNTRLQWLPPTSSNSDPGEADGAENVEHPRAVPNWNDLFLFVDEEQGSRLYLKRGSGSAFDVYPRASTLYSIEFGSGLVAALDQDADGGGWLACVSASDLKGGRGLTVRMYQHADEDQQAPRETILLNPRNYCFDVESTPITNSSHGDSELFKISIRPWRSEVKQGSIRCWDFKFALE